MGLEVSVRGGTRAGWRTVRTQGESWDCELCERHNARYLIRCKGCGALRPS
jgi:hypothetical protein